MRNKTGPEEARVNKWRWNMERLSLERELKENAYPGRGIVIGLSEDGTKVKCPSPATGFLYAKQNRLQASGLPLLLFKMDIP